MQSLLAAHRLQHIVALTAGGRLDATATTASDRPLRRQRVDFACSLPS
jgi:hypothetical protein